MWGNGWAPFRVSPDVVAHGRKRLDTECEKIGRDVSEIEITIFMDPLEDDKTKSKVKDYFDAGANRVVFIVESTPEKNPLESIRKIARSVGM